MEQQNIHGEGLPIYKISKDGEDSMRKVLNERVFVDLRVVLDTILERLGRSKAEYTIIEGGEAIVKVETRRGILSFSSNATAKSEDQKKWIAVSRAIDVILADEGLEVRDASHLDLAWADKALKNFEAARADFIKEVKELENRIDRVLVANKELRELLDA